MGRPATIACLSFLVTTGCLHEAAPLEPPPRAGIGAPGYQWPPRELSAESPAAQEPIGLPSPVQDGPVSTTVLPVDAPGAVSGGERCLLELASLGIEYRALDSRRGVTMPVVVDGPIGQIRYVSGAGLPLELDCRMVLVLHRIAPILSSLGVQALRFSGAYVFRLTRKGRPSLHAHGLAIDVHAAQVDGQWLEVSSQFARNAGCGAGAPPLNRIACALHDTGWFKETLTPDYNADHHDHFHLAIARRGDEPEGPPGGSRFRGAHASR